MDKIIQGGTIECEKCKKIKFISEYKMRCQSYLRSFCTECHNSLKPHQRRNEVRQFHLYCEMCLYPGNDQVFVTKSRSIMKKHQQEMHKELKICANCKQLLPYTKDFFFLYKGKKVQPYCKCCMNMKYKI